MLRVFCEADLFMAPRSSGGVREARGGVAARARTRTSGENDSSVGQYVPVRSQRPPACGTLVATAPPGSPVPVGRFFVPPRLMPLSCAPQGAPVTRVSDPRA
ncbi:hypothetical protein GCM10010253_37580 [Streptomyces badius]|uniref:Uncharacterized protein n=1 Tax=Streptomyces badius TaxID=1941 RepID=A0ABQ2TCD7_STRBA|nr:hypothetical protein GCM10010253_37580 [Streptomyces badius]